MATIIDGNTLSKPLNTSANSLSPIDSRQKIYVESENEVNPFLFEKIVNPYPHLRVHVHKKINNSEELCIGVYEIDKVEIITDPILFTTSGIVREYHQVYSTAFGKESAKEEDGYLNTTKNTDSTITTYNEKYKNIIFYTDTNKVYLNGELYGGEIEEGSISEVMLDNTLKEKVESISTLSGKLNSLFWSSATFNLTANPSTIYAGVETSVTFTATFTSSSIEASEVDEIRITSDDKYNNVVASSTRSKTASYTENKTLAAGASTTLYSKVTVGTNYKTKYASVSAYNKIYYGPLGKEPDASNYSSLTLHTATSTAVGKTLGFTATANGQAFYLIVPSDVVQPTGCTNTSGVAQGFTRMGTVKINDITYNKYRLGGSSYNSGASFTFRTT